MDERSSTATTSGASIMAVSWCVDGDTPIRRETAMANANKIVSDYQQAMGKGDFIAARRLLHDDLSFQGPIETFNSPEPYLESLKKLHQIIQRIDMKKIFADGDEVCVLYDMVTNT